MRTACEVHVWPDMGHPDPRTKQAEQKQEGKDSCSATLLACCPPGEDCTASPPTAIQTGAQWFSSSLLLRCWHWREMPHFLHPFSHTRWKMWLPASYMAAVFCGCWQSVPGKTFGVNLGPNFLLHCKLFSQTISSSLRIKHKEITSLYMRCLVSIIWPHLPSS